jgi:hypothetical protein
MAHDDEILLSHFHILELLSEKYYIKQKQIAIQSINQFTEKILDKIYLLEQPQLQQELQAKRKLIEGLFISELPVGSKIMFMLQEQGILTLRLKLFISDLIKDRNSVAHGKQVYQERIIFPVPPFFPLIRMQDYPFEVLRLLSGRAIALFINSKHLRSEWKQSADLLMPTFNELNAFIVEKKFTAISVRDFYEGKENDIIPYTIAYYLINKKLTPEKAMAVLENVILNYKETEEESTQLVLSAILIVDVAKDNLKSKCMEIIKLASQNGWMPFIKMRDVLYYLEYLGHHPVTLREMIANDQIR